MKRSSIYFLLALLLVPGVLPALASDALVVYSGRSDKFVKPVLKAFTEQSGIRVILHSGKSTALLNKLRLEGAASEADLYLSNDAGNLQKGSDMGLFRPLPAALVAPIAANYRAADDTWVGLSARARVLVVNTEGPWAERLHSVFDLADPALRGQIGITTSSNGSFIAGVTVYMLAAGEARTRRWLEGLKANSEGRVFNKHSKIVKAVARGRRQAGLVNHYYIYRHLAKDPDAPIRIVIPDQGPEGMGVAWNVAGIAVSRHTKKRAQAEALVAFLVSEAGQRMFAEMNMEYPTRAGVPAAPQVPPAGSYKVADVPMAELGRQRDATLDLIEAVGMP